MKQYIKTFESFKTEMYKRLNESVSPETLYTPSICGPLSLSKNLKFILDLNSSEFSQLFNMFDDNILPESVIYYILEKGIKKLNGTSLNSSTSSPEGSGNILGDSKFRDNKIFPILIGDKTSTFSKLGDYKFKIPNLNEKDFTSSENYYETSLNEILYSKTFFANIVDKFKIDTSDGMMYYNNKSISEASTIYEPEKIPQAFDALVKDQKKVFFNQAFNKFKPKSNQTDTILSTSGNKNLKTDAVKDKKIRWLQEVNSFLNSKITEPGLVSKILNNSDGMVINLKNEEGSEKFGINPDSVDLPKS